MAEPVTPRRGYGLVLLLILATLAVTTATSPSGPTDALAVTLRGATLVLVLYAAGMRRRVVRLGTTLVVVAVVAASGIEAVEDQVVWTSGVVSVLLVGAAPVLIARDLFRRPAVTAQTLAGALSIYLLIGLFFAAAFGIVAELGTGDVFATGDGTPADHLYFSLITLTTVGYGDLVPGSDVSRALAWLEAVFGQLYLVTVVAVVVGNLGHERATREAERRRTHPDG